MRNCKNCFKGLKEHQKVFCSQDCKHEYRRKQADRPSFNHNIEMQNAKLNMPRERKIYNSPFS